MIRNLDLHYIEKESFSNYAMLTKEAVIEDVQKGRHEALIEYLKTGGILDGDFWDDSEPLLMICFENLNPAQRKEVFFSLSDPGQISSRSLLWLLLSYRPMEQKMAWFEELLSGLERLNYSFDDVYTWLVRHAVNDQRLAWVHFFLTHPIKGLDLNQPVMDELMIKVHPYTEMKLLATRLIIENAFNMASDSEETTDTDGQERSSLYDQMIEYAHELIRIMENHPGIDLAAARNEIERLSETIDFEGSAKFEKNVVFFSDAKTLKGLEKHIAAGFDLYQPVGSFGALAGMWNMRWIELLCDIYGYKEAKLIDLMEKYAS